MSDSWGPRYHGPGAKGDRPFEVTATDAAGKGPSGRFRLYALAVYLGLSFLYFGLPVLSRFNTRYIGLSSDPTVFMWSFKWIIYALGHRLNPFYTHLVWAPKGYDLSFTTFIPGISLLSIPLTLMFGPVATYNIWQIINPALGGFFSFLVCYHLTRRYFPSLAGGYVFGFSAYEVLQNLDHLNLSTIFLIPLMVYLVLLLLDGKIGKRIFIGALSLALILQFLTSLEVFTTFTMFGTTVMLISYLFAPEAKKGPLRECLLPLALSYLFTIIIVSPYLYLAIRNAPAGYVHDPYYWVNDLLNFVIPTPYLGLSGLFASITDKFTGNAAEFDAYFGLGLFIILYLFARDNWREPRGRLLLLAFILPAAASLGPMVHIAGKAVFPSPFLPLSYIPLIKEAQPNRMVIYSSLPAAVMAAVWLSQKITLRRMILVLFALELLLPGLPYPSSATGVPPFISQGLYKTYIPRGSNVLIVPFANQGNSMLWQAETNFYFTMAGGYLGYPPREDANLPVVRTLLTGRSFPGLSGAMKSFLAANQVRDVLVDASLPGTWRDLFRGLGVTPRLVGGVWLYQVPTLTQTP